ncbi:MAG: glycine cleavage system aminomethyltransferase GcvT [Deltaproteobacteria bacterium]|nr:glycine cleavage system aminomethyltransferase GcvT [Deltaproteobacteria bacterium]
MQALKKTPLHARHLELQARMAPFAGYDMPISYDSTSGGMMKEHLAVRKDVGIFDVSHMGEFWVRGKDATAYLTKTCTRPFENLIHFKAQYCLLLKDDGTIVDDIIVYKFDSENYWVVVNASNIDKDFAHMKSLSSGFQVTLEDVSEKTALIAIQGPRAVEIMKDIFPQALELKYYAFYQPKNGWIVGRTGYTGEDGFEVFLPVEEAMNFWMQLEKKGGLPIGLGARDTLRLEVGFPLYGHELSDQLRPMETFSAFATNLNSSFVGVEKARLAPRYKAVAVQSQTPKPMRADESLFWNGKRVGWLTSGSTSPVKKVGIGLALIDLSQINVPLETGFIFMLESGGKQREAVLTATPFVTTARVQGAKKSLKKTA